MADTAIYTDIRKGIPMNKCSLLSEFDSAEISDALDSLQIEGVLLGIRPLTTGVKLVGPVFTVKYEPYHQQPDHFKSAGDYIDTVPTGAVILVDNEGRDDCTTWGDILTQVALQKGIAGTVIHGACRDVQLILELGYPVFSKAITMRSGKNRVYKAYEQVELQIGNVHVKPGDILFADDAGALVIPQQHVETIIKRAKNIRQTELLIIDAIKAGMPLAEARRLHRYDQPWLHQTDRSC